MTQRQNPEPRLRGPEISQLQMAAFHGFYNSQFLRGVGVGGRRCLLYETWGVTT